MKKFLIFLILFIPIVKAETYYLDERPITDLNLNVIETKKYRWYQEKRVEAFFLEGTNTNDFPYADQKFYYTAYSE